jgi:CheY-like chemotaxis protein
MGGDIVATGAPQQGATFTAFLEFGPALRPGAEKARSLSSPPSVSRAAAAPVADDFSVLIAEDNRINALLARKVIERAGGRATVVEDGRSAIAAIRDVVERRRPAFDLILMDVLMPGVDGLAAARAIKALFEERQHLGVAPPIIALTANAFPEDRDRCRAAGMDDYLAKPFDAQHLHDLLLRWVSRRPDRAPPAA